MELFPVKTETKKTTEEHARVIHTYAWFPLGLEIRENLEKWEGIFQSGKSQGILPKILEKQENLNKKNVFCESQGILHKMLENQWI